MLNEQFTIDHLLTRVLPGGFVIGLVFFVSGTQLPQNQNFDFLYSFMFFCTAFIVGEILQTLSHETEFLVDVFFKGYRPSEIFLFQNNPIINNDGIRKKLIKKLDIPRQHRDVFERSYSDIPVIMEKKAKERQISQEIFWNMYSKVETDENVKRTNINYLFTRIMATTFLLACAYLLFCNLLIYGLISFVIFAIFVWRARGLARGLVFKSALKYLGDLK